MGDSAVCGVVGCAIDQALLGLSVKLAEQSRPVAGTDVLLRVARCSGLDNALREAYWQLLDDVERTRNQRFRFQADRDRHLLGRALLRSSIAEWLGTKPQALSLRLDAHGKPQLGNAPNVFEEPAASEQLHFNLSHSGDWVVVALANVPVGIDVEHTLRKSDVLSLAAHYFYGEELKELQSFPEPEQRERFFDYWTLKEAYMKARGEGISLGLENFGFRLHSEGACAAQANTGENSADKNRIELMLNESLQDNPQAWQFFCVSPVAEYRLALAVRSAGKATIRTEEYWPFRESTPLDWRLN